LAALISSRFGVPFEHVVVGAGSIGILQALFAATCEAGAEVVYAWRSFEAYPGLVLLSGADPVPVPLRHEAHDLAAMADAITPRTRMVLVCNPNNPTGTVVGRRMMNAFLDRVPTDCLVVLDEAYRDFVDGNVDTPEGAETYRERPNLVVVRTFSKAQGLAGLRVGFLIAQAPVATAVRTVQLPYAVSHLAQVAAIAALRAGHEVSRRVRAVMAERHRVRETLAGLGWRIPAAHGNFVWLPLGSRAEEFAAACEVAGISVRCFAGEGVRASIGSPGENDRFLAVARAFRGRPSAAEPVGLNFMAGPRVRSSQVS
jgi:histidinol-phosphate aminotransferase